MQRQPAQRPDRGRDAWRGAAGHHGARADAGSGSPASCGEAGVWPTAHPVVFIGADRSEEADPPELYGGSVPLRKALGSVVLLDHEMNDRPLAAVHGTPVRVVVPGYIGARSVKWLRRIEVPAEPWDS